MNPTGRNVTCTLLKNLVHTVCGFMIISSYIKISTSASQNSSIMLSHVSNTMHWAVSTLTRGSLLIHSKSEREGPRFSHSFHTKWCSRSVFTTVGRVLARDWGKKGEERDLTDISLEKKRERERKILQQVDCLLSQQEAHIPDAPQLRQLL